MYYSYDVTYTGIVGMYTLVHSSLPIPFCSAKMTKVHCKCIQRFTGCLLGNVQKTSNVLYRHSHGRTSAIHFLNFGAGHIRIYMQNIELTFIKVWVFWEGHKNWKNLHRNFDKSVVFCAHNSILVKKSTKIFKKKFGQVVLDKLFKHGHLWWPSLLAFGSKRVKLL